MKIEDVVPFGNSLKALFVAYKTPVVAFDADYDDPWITDTFDAQKDAVNSMVVTLGLRKLNAEDTKTRNDWMDKETELLNKLDYVVKKCIKNGTITDGVGSFGIGAFLKSITQRDIENFHVNYQVTKARIASGGNAAALNTAGFTTANVASLKNNHDKAWDMNTTKINLKQDISTLSIANQGIVDTFMTTCMGLLKAIRAYAKSISDKELAKKATKGAVLSTVGPMPEKKPRVKTLEPGSRVVISNIPSKYKMQMTLETKGGKVKVCKQELRSNECTDGIALMLDAMLEVTKSGLPGTGDYVVLTNEGDKVAKVKWFVVKVV